MRPPGAALTRRSRQVNHFPGANELGRKDKLARCLAASALGAPPGAFAFSPRTFCLPADAEAWAAEQAAAARLAAPAAASAAACAAASPSSASTTPLPPLAAPADAAAQAATAHGEGGAARLYIAKPPALSRGRGVRVVDAGQVCGAKKLLVQRYIHPPHTLDGLKYDLRLYVLVTSVAPLRAYVHSYGLVRFATAPYDLDSRDGASHVTNVSARCKPEAAEAAGGAGGGAGGGGAGGGAGGGGGDDPVADDAAAQPPPSAPYVPNVRADDDGCGHKWSLAALRRRLEAAGADWAPLWASITDVVARTLIAAHSRMGAAVPASGAPEGACFELYGFDVLLDASLRPWLLEVNTGPNLAAPTPLDTHIKCRVAAEMLHLAGIAPPEPRRRRGGANAPPSAPAGAQPPGGSVGLAAYAAAMAPPLSASSAASSPLTGASPLSAQPLCVRRMVAEAGRAGAFQRVFPSHDPDVNARLLPLFRPPCAGAAAMCEYVAHHAGA